MAGLSKNKWVNQDFVFLHWKWQIKISGWSKYASADTILALKATKMLQYIVLIIVLLNGPSMYFYQTTSGLRLNKIGMVLNWQCDCCCHMEDKSRIYM